jgi:hypothetical protein
LTVFTGASLVAALADSTAMLLAARAAQGVGAAMLSPAALALVTTTFPEGPQRRRALAAWAAVAAGGAAFGVLAGGALTEAFDWPAIFLVNVPVGVAVGLAALRVLPAARPARRGRLDAGGALLVTGSLVALIYALVEAPSAGWGSAQTVGLLALAAAGLAAFAALESRLAEPLVDLRVLTRRPTAVALAVMLGGMGTVLASFFFLTLYLQGVLGHSALRTGLEFLPGAVLLVLTAHAGGHLVARAGAKVVLAGGMALAAAGVALLTGVSADGRYLTDVLPGLLVLDAGFGLAASGVFITAMSGVGHDEAGLVSGLLTTSHEIGGALVLPVLATVATSGLGAQVLDHAARLDPAVLAGGIGDAFGGAVAIALGAALLALAGLRRTDVTADPGMAFAH